VQKGDLFFKALKTGEGGVDSCSISWFILRAQKPEEKVSNMKIRTLTLLCHTPFAQE
jgi:hypothetical protein